jgi:hypothetical protein
VGASVLVKISPTLIPGTPTALGRPTRPIIAKPWAFASPLATVCLDSKKVRGFVGWPEKFRKVSALVHLLQDVTVESSFESSVTNLSLGVSLLLPERRQILTSQKPVP